MKRNYLGLCLCFMALAGLVLTSCNKKYVDDTLSVSVSGTDIAATYAGGEYDFYYAVYNGTDDGIVTCGTDADWITGFTYVAANGSIPATVRFSVDENSGASSRSGKINFLYSCSEGSLNQTITVLQAGGGSRDTEFNTADMTGTYKASAKALYSLGTLYNVTWTLIIMNKEDGSLYIDGLLPFTEGSYDSLGDNRASATAYLNENSELVVPSGMASCQVQTYYGSYYVGYTPCIQYNYLSGVIYYDDDFPDLTFTYDSSTGTWTADYGIICVGCTDQNIDSLSIFVDQVFPSVTLTKTSDYTPDVSSVGSGAGDPASTGLSADKAQKARSLSGK